MRSAYASGAARGTRRRRHSRSWEGAFAAATQRCEQREPDAALSFPIVPHRRLLATKISERTMGFAGGATFLLFGILACFEGALLFCGATDQRPCQCLTRCLRCAPDPTTDITTHAMPSFFGWGGSSSNA